jgi:voltage-gated potassium channel
MSSVLSKSKNKDRLYEIIFEADTRSGRIFDICLIILIFISIMLVIFDSIESVHNRYYLQLRAAEWIITFIFTIEYLLRIYAVKWPLKYIFSFYGIIDLIAILPGYIVFIFSAGQNLIVLRAIRFLRVFRILKLNRYSHAGRYLGLALIRSREKIIIFLAVILALVVIFGTIMYIVEGEKNVFTNIPVGIYWAIVTITTVGYGDIAPATGVGQLIASIIMIMGYAIIAVPTGIITSEIIRLPSSGNTQVCSNCLFDLHDDDAVYCKKCGAQLNPGESNS